MRGRSVTWASGWHRGSRIEKGFVRWDSKFRKNRESNECLSLTYTQDYSIVLLTVEELIAAGATELALDLSLADIFKE
jgi:hypothetical protein